MIDGADPGDLPPSDKPSAPPTDESPASQTPAEQPSEPEEFAPVQRERRPARAPESDEDLERKQHAQRLADLLAGELNRRQFAARRELTLAELYVLERWRELCAEDGPWWTRGDGVGLRLRLRELLNLASARREGALKDRPIAELITQGRDVLGRKSGLLNRRYHKWSAAMQKALKAKPEHWHPAGQAHALVQSTLELLNDPLYLTALRTLLEQQVAEVNPAELVTLDELVELLDAELAFDGHSPAWRLRVAAETQERMEAGTRFAHALDGALALLRRGQRRTMQVLFRLTATPPAFDQAVIKLPFHASQGAEQLIGAWGAEPEEGIELEHGALVLKVVRAADPEAALARAESWLARLLGLWSLQDSKRPALDDHAWVYDPHGPEVHRFRRPAPLRLVPEGLARHQARLAAEERRAEEDDEDDAVPAAGRRWDGQLEADPLGDALIQLAQARTGSAGSALTDLWMVAEALFAGVAAEPKSHASHVIAGCLQARYVRDALRWLAIELEGSGRLAPSGKPRAAWALQQLHDDRDAIVAELAGRPLALARAQQLSRWLEGEALQRDLMRLRERVRGVADRAYLVRNFFVHAAQPERAAALNATLLPFAGMVHAALGLVAGDDRPPLVAAQSAAVTVEQLAYDLCEGEINRAQAPRAFELAVALDDT